VPSADYLPRVADGLLDARLGAMGAVLIEGVKGCGKTETARRWAASEVLLESDANAERRALLDPRLILDGATPRLLDEWQRVPRVWDAVRRAVDDRRRPGQFILTGSATPDDSVQRHSGAGRFAVVEMRTMTLVEKRSASPRVSVAGLLAGVGSEPVNCPVGFRDYLDHMIVGGWPYLVGASQSAAQVFLDGYLDLIIEHDIDEVSSVTRNPRLVRRFLQAYAQLTAHPASLSTILRRAHDDLDSEAVGPSRYAATDYLDALRRMRVVDEVSAWDPSVRSSKRLTATPKRHLGDVSLAVSLLGLGPARLLDDLNTTGYLFESLVAHELKVYSAAARAQVFHYREMDGRLEVDYVLEDRAGDWVGIEVKMGEHEVEKAAHSLIALADRVSRPPRALAVVTATSMAYTRDDGVHVIPLGCLGP
jgi:predicted AAA+ superfamily ATPase